MYKMHHPKVTQTIRKGRKEGGRGLLQNKIKHKVQIINTAEYLNTKYIEGRFENIVKSHESNQPNLNSTFKPAAKVAEELNHANGNSDTQKRKAFNQI